MILNTYDQLFREYFERECKTREILVSILPKLKILISTNKLSEIYKKNKKQKKDNKKDK